MAASKPAQDPRTVDQFNDCIEHELRQRFGMHAGHLDYDVLMRTQQRDPHGRRVDRHSAGWSAVVTIPGRTAGLRGVVNVNVAYYPKAAWAVDQPWHAYVDAVADTDRADGAWLDLSMVSVDTSGRGRTLHEALNRTMRRLSKL